MFLQKNEKFRIVKYLSMHFNTFSYGLFLGKHNLINSITSLLEALEKGYYKNEHD